MSKRTWEFHALDTLFFRDGTPYNAGEGGQTGVAGRFPPFMSTLQGAIRTALAYGQGWRPEEPDKWPQELGDYDDIGKLKLNGPYLCQAGKMLFPAPHLLIEKKDPEPEKHIIKRLVPGAEVLCDLGKVRLPKPAVPLKGAKVMEGQWLTIEGMKAVLDGDSPDQKQVIEREKLWQTEHRVGLERDADSRTAVDSRLYSCVHVRPERNISLAVEVSGVSQDWHDRAAKTIPLGGEGRLARVDIKNSPPSLPRHPDLQPVNGIVRFTATLITPGCYNVLKNVALQGPPGIPGKCVSACLGKIHQMGGWDIKNRIPRPLQALIPPGSTWFFEAKETEIEQVYSLHGQCLGETKADKTNYGFGQILIGCWEE